MRGVFKRKNLFIRKMMLVNDVTQDDLAIAMYMCKNTLVRELDEELSDERKEEYIQKIFEINKSRKRPCYKVTEVKE